MNRTELIERLKGYEWSDVEFKEALDACPKSSYETVSAFANTSGGWLIFGVREDNGAFEIVGVRKVNKVETDFLSALNSSKKISCSIPVEESIIKDDSSILITFFIPEARREDKPVYLDRDIRKSFIRRGSGDHRCSGAEIKAFLREASDETYDSELIDIDITNCFEAESINWYREAWQRRNPGKMDGVSDTAFLKHFGLIGEIESKMLSIRAALLLFGNEATILKLLARPVVDFRRVTAGFDDVLPDQRWDDRDVLECNLISSWRRILELYQKVANVPFKLDAATLERDDKPVDYTAFREAVINLLTHQDFGDQQRKASIQIYRDRMIFWNPGASFVSKEDMFKPGDRRIRNPRIAGMFRRIGLGEQAGTGIGAIYSNWRILGRVPPVIEDDKSDRNFCLTLLGEDLVSEEQVLFQASLGVHLSEEEAAVFAHVWRGGQIWSLEAKAITGLSNADTESLLNRLIVQQLIEAKVGQQQTHYVLSEHLREILASQTGKGATHKKIISLVTDQDNGKRTSLVTDQVKPLKKLSEIQLKIIQFSDSPHPIALIMKHLGVTNRTFFRRTHLDPLLKGGILKMTHPDSPKHRNQAYVLTETGFDLKKRLNNKVKD
jgi:ATP-dependent DNA helicase RecG